MERSQPGRVRVFPGWRLMELPCLICRTKLGMFDKKKEEKSGADEVIKALEALEPTQGVRILLQVQQKPLKFKKVSVIYIPKRDSDLWGRMDCRGREWWFPGKK